MALADAVLEVAKAMEQEGSIPTFDPCLASKNLSLRSFARELRTAVKAAEGVAGVSSYPGASLADPQTFHRSMIDRARAEFRKAPDEGEMTRVVEVADSDPPLSAPVPADMPVGAFVDIGGTVYALWTDGKLHVAAPFQNLVEVGSKPKVVDGEKAL